MFFEGKQDKNCLWSALKQKDDMINNMLLKKKIAFIMMD